MAITSSARRISNHPKQAATIKAVTIPNTIQFPLPTEYFFPPNRGISISGSRDTSATITNSPLWAFRTGSREKPLYIRKTAKTP